ncbi:MAG: hypothetical protein RSB55_09430, partial [Oscillospiraceae bacterium]
MKKIRNRALSLVLTLCMVLSMLPMGAVTAKAAELSGEMNTTQMKEALKSSVNYDAATGSVSWDDFSKVTYSAGTLDYIAVFIH